MLTLTDIEISYGGIRAVRGISVSVSRGVTIGIVGPNGAGKSSLLRAVSGHVRPSAGRITLDAEDITGEEAWRIARRGVAHVPEGRRIIGGLSVADNLLLASRSMTGSNARQARVAVDEAFDVFPLLAPLRNRDGAALSGGEQQLLALARALVCRPTILLCDEPTMGLAPIMVSHVVEALSALRAGTPNLGILLVEQGADTATSLCDTILLCSQGRVVYEGAPGSVTDELLRSAYFGSPDATTRLK